MDTIILDSYEPLHLIMSKSMEIAAYFLLGVIWWQCSFTVLLPFTLILITSKSMRNKWFSFFFPNIISPLCSHIFLPLRKRIFKLLEERLSGRDKSVPLEILEIGMGAGANLQFYPKNSNLIALDINPEFVKVFVRNRKNFPQVNYKRTVLNMAENMKDIPDSTFDVVINTHVLCSVRNVHDVLKEVKRVLKPGGKYIFLEHVAFPSSEWGYFLQVFVAPIWNIFFDRCWPVRNNEDAIRKAGFSDVYCETKYPPNLLLYFRPQLIGIAVK